MIVIPMQANVARFRFRTELDGQTFTLAFDWNDRVSAWFFSLYDENLAPLSQGVKVVLGLCLFSPLNGLGMPAGLLICEDTSSLGLDPGYYDLGERCKIHYYEADELE